MRRQLRAVWPELAHWFGLKPWDLEHLTWAELDELSRRLRHLPPIGGTVIYQPK